MIGKAFRWLMNGFLKMFGDLKVFKWPFFLVYDPSSYRVKGDDVRQVINLAQPGDILIRGYKNYLDGYFIPGYFSHAGLYVGEVNEKDQSLLTSKHGLEFFETGEQMVVHAMAEGVFMEDLINFCRCDHMLILRFPEKIKAVHQEVAADLATDNFTSEELDFNKTLFSGKTLSFEKIWPIVFRLALGQVGKPYDFQFNFSNYNNLSCTELVEFVYKSLESYHGLSPAKKRFLIFAKEVLTPDAFVSSNLEIAWQSQSVQKAKLAKLRSK